MSALRLVASSLLLFAFAMPVIAQEYQKTLEGLIQAIERSPSLYAKFGKAAGADLPRFNEVKLAEFRVRKQDSFAEQYKQWKTNEEQYAKGYRLRASLFKAIDAAVQTNRLAIRIELSREDATPKAKAAFLRLQETLGIAIFQIEQVLPELKKADEHRGQETSKYWRAHFDWAQAQLEGDILFLYEYNFTLGQIRADNLPPLAASDDGWTIAFHPKLRITEAKAKDLAKHRQKLLKKIQEDYADTPWAYFAERESRRSLGMEWMAMKK